MSHPATSPAHAAAIAAHRFGLGEPRLTEVGDDAPQWLLAQIGPADAQQGDKLATARDGVVRFVEFREAQRRRREPAMEGMAARDTAAEFGEHFRTLVQADLRARLGTATATARPFAERLALFWANHFTVSMAKASARGLVGAFEREAIRPHIAGSFETMLKAAVTHAGMLRYLDNEQSAGPNSRFVRRGLARLAGNDAPRITGLNENLAREVLELHTLGVNGGYTQADVTAFARVLTGWRIPYRAVMSGEIADGATPVRFDPLWHEPGAKVVLGKTYREGAEALYGLLHDLAHHPATARLVATKLARHFVADDPPPALVDRLAARFLVTGGDLPAVYRELVLAPEAWGAAPAKLKSPEEFVISAVRVLGLREQAFQRLPDGGAGVLGQRVQAAPSPAGWPDRAEEWLGPEAVWKRVEWSVRIGERLGARVDARELARASLGPLLSAGSSRQIDRAADGAQALALMLMAPEFQRR
jgi:uncharacterized protein (DUF1800 family)